MREVRAAPNREMAVGWRVSPWGDGGGQKHVEDRGSSVAAVDEMRARLAMGGGERGRKKKRARCRAGSF
jgi:hypothetical protein